MEEVIVCDGGIFKQRGNRVPFKIAECSAYHPMNVPWLHEMEQMAWKIEARKRGPTGFAKAGNIPQEDGDNNEMEVTVEPPKRPRRPLDDYYD